MLIKFDNTELDLPVNDNSCRYRAIKGEHSLMLYYSLPEHIEIPLGAYCEFEGETYALESPENFTKHGTRNFEYTLIMEAAQSLLSRYKFRDTTTGKLKFSLTARPKEHLQMLVDNLNQREQGNWTAGTCIDAVEKVISYNHAFCSDALSQIAEAFETEWEIIGKTINLCKVEHNKENPLPLSYGRGNGFKSGVGRSNTDNKKPVEILFVQGGERNIDASKYGSTELLLPKNQTVGYDGQYFSDQPEFDATKARWYVTDEYGFSLRRSDKPLTSQAEDSLDCSHIYPSRMGSVSEVVVVDEENHFYDFIDNSIPNDLDYSKLRLDGETITIIFQEGMLAGKEFEIEQTETNATGYVHSERRFKLKSQEIDGQTMPNNVFCPKVGEKYAVFGITLPDAYIIDDSTKSGASWDMFREAVKYKYENEEQKFTFTGELDGIWAKKDWQNIGERIRLGGYVLFSDGQFQPDGIPIRITGIKDYINNPHSPTIELSNEIVAGSIVSDLRKIETNEVIVDDLHRNAVQFTKRRFRDAQETSKMLEAAMLDNFTNSISPISVKTMQLLAGDESLQFQFVDRVPESNAYIPQRIKHEVTYGTDKVLHSVFDGRGQGVLQHMTIGIKEIKNACLPKEYTYWTLPKYDSQPLTEASEKYYLYAKCSKSNATGRFILSNLSIGMEDEDGYYHFLVALVNSEYEGKRSVVTLYGFTEILPGRITTDKIISSDGQNFIDLVNNAFRTGNQSSSIDWNVTAQNVLTLLNVAIKLGVNVNSTGIQLNPDGSGQLADGAINWDTAGFLKVTGIVKQSTTIITPENYMKYVYYEEDFGSYTFDFNKMSLDIEFKGIFPVDLVETIGYLYLPYSLEYSYTVINIKNNSNIPIPLSGYSYTDWNHPESGTSYSLQPGQKVIYIGIPYYSNSKNELEMRFFRRVTNI
ncbi:MAG: hypothetical protein LBG28_08560 [Tannerella sp.]|jgi:hypothetical protein|nr:hypothetical protein [Tannerella sp.]